MPTHALTLVAPPASAERSFRSRRSARAAAPNAHVLGVEIRLVGAARLELATPCARCMCYAPARAAQGTALALAGGKIAPAQRASHACQSRVPLYRSLGAVSELPVANRTCSDDGFSIGIVTRGNLIRAHALWTASRT